MKYIESVSIGFDIGVGSVGLFLVAGWGLLLALFVVLELVRNGWMTVASATAVAISLTLLGIFLAIIMNATKLAEDIENNVDVSVLVDIGTTQEDIDTLKQELENLPNVKSVKFSSKDEDFIRSNATIVCTMNIF